MLTILCIVCSLFRVRQPEKKSRRTVAGGSGFASEERKRQQGDEINFITWRAEDADVLKK